LIDRALALNPSYARGWEISGTLRMWAGELDLAISHFETSLRLSPIARRSGTFMLIGAWPFLRPTI
jgi:adenylate cyclase